MGMNKAAKLLTDLVSDFAGWSKQAAGEVKSIAKEGKDVLKGTKDGITPEFVERELAAGKTISESLPEQFERATSEINYKPIIDQTIKDISGEAGSKSGIIESNISQILNLEKISDLDPKIHNMTDVVGVLENKGLSSDAVKEFQSTRNVTDFVSNVRNMVEENILAEALDDAVARSLNNMHSDSVSKILKTERSKNKKTSTIMKIAELNAKSRKGEELYRQMLDNTKWRRKFLGFTKYFGNTMTLASDTAMKLHKIGANSSSEKIQSYWKLMDRGGSVSSTVKSAVGELAYKVSQMSPAKKQAWVTYYENRNLGRLQDVAVGNSLTNKAIPVDVELINSNEMFKQLSYEDLALANQTTNLMKSIAKTKSEFSRGIYSNTNMSPRLDDYSIGFMEKNASDSIAHSPNMSYGGGDFGGNYLPVVANKEYFDKFLSEGKGVILDEYADTVYKMNYNQKAYRKKGGSNLRNSYDSRVPMEEALLSYANGFDRMILKDSGNEILASAAASMGMDIAIRKGTGQLALPSDKNAYQSVMRDLVDAHNSKFNVARKPRSEMNSLEKAIDTFMQGQIALLLSGNPKMWLFNANQFIVNGVSHNGLRDTWKGTMEQTALMKEVVRNKGSLDKAYRAIEQGTEDKATAAMLRRFYRDHPAMYEFNLEELMPMGDNSGAMRTIVNTALAPFKMSDKLSRYGSFFSAKSAAERHLKTFQKSMRGMDAKTKPQAIAKLYKDLHMDVFQYPKRMEMLNLLQDASDTSVMNEFVYQYASHAVMVDNFNYSKVGSTLFADKMKNFSPTLGSAAVFTSWSMHYYSHIATGAVRALKNGDTGPLKMLGLMSAAWLTAAGAAMQSENETIASVGRYAGTRVPMMQPMISLTEMGSKGMLGLVQNVFDVPTYAAKKTMDEYTNLFGDAKSGMEYDIVKLEANLRNNPLAPTWILDYLEGIE